MFDYTTVFREVPLFSCVIDFADVETLDVLSEKDPNERRKGKIRNGIVLRKQEMLLALVVNIP